MVVHALGSVEDDIFKCGIAVSPIVDLNYYGEFTPLSIHEFTALSMINL